MEKMIQDIKEMAELIVLGAGRTEAGLKIARDIERDSTGLKAAFFALVAKDIQQRLLN